MLGSCRASYRLAVPDNVPLEIQTSQRLRQPHGRARVGAGQHRLGRRSPPAGFCGFSLRAGSDTGDVRALVGVLRRPARAALAQPATCARSCPSGRYQIDAQSDTGTVRIRGLTNAPDAPFQIQALSTSGDVTVEAAS